MALTKPILYSTAAFDATEDKVFTFNVIGGDQVVANQLTIVRQSDNTIVYQNTQTTFSYTHTLPANSLTNGVYYSAYIITYNALNQSSSASSSIQFYCYSTPTFEFSNIPSSNIITNATYNFEVTYDQAEGEILNSYSFNLYDVQGLLVATSGVQYITGGALLPLTISYTFSGLQDNTIYAIQATGQTLQSTQISTNRASFSVSYTTPNVFSVIGLTNNCKEGYIIVNSNLSGIDGESNPSPPVYVDNNTAVDLTQSGSYVLYEGGYDLSENFTASLWGRNFAVNESIIILSNNGGTTLTIKYREDSVPGYYYADLTVSENGVIYYIYSDSILVNNGDNVQIWFRRIGGLYQIGLYNLTS